MYKNIYVQGMRLTNIITIEEKNVTKISTFSVLCCAKCSHLGQRAGPPDTILEEDHPMAILSKFGSN
jgi:hypothetical protein